MNWPDEFTDADVISGDRRGDRRYRIDLELRWKLIRRRKLRDAGTGRTIDLSSGGILFDAGRPLPAGHHVELSINWPVLLHNVAPLQLVVMGKIIRGDGGRIGVQMIQHEFRTIGLPSEHREVISTPTRIPALFTRHASLGFEKLQ